MKRFSVLLAALAVAACSSSSSSGTSSSSSSSSSGGTPTDGGTFATDATTTTTPTKGLTLSNATDTTINGTYDIQVTRFAAQSGGGYAFNGNYQEKVEIEVDTDASGTVLAAHVWSFDGAVPPSPNAFYGCDNKATACTGVKVDVATNVITISTVTWPEVQQPTSFDGTAADTLVAGGKKVTVSGVITATPSQ